MRHLFHPQPFFSWSSLTCACFLLWITFPGWRKEPFLTPNVCTRCAKKEKITKKKGEIFPWDGLKILRGEEADSSRTVNAKPVWNRMQSPQSDQTVLADRKRLSIFCLRALEEPARKETWPDAWIYVEDFFPSQAKVKVMLTVTDNK